MILEYSLNFTAASENNIKGIKVSDIFARLGRSFAAAQL